MFKSILLLSFFLVISGCKPPGFKGSVNPPDNSDNSRGENLEQEESATNSDSTRIEVADSKPTNQSEGLPGYGLYCGSAPDDTISPPSEAVACQFMKLHFPFNEENPGQGRVEGALGNVGTYEKLSPNNLKLPEHTKAQGVGGGVAVSFNGEYDWIETNFPGITGPSSWTVSVWLRTTTKNGVLIQWGDESGNDASEQHLMRIKMENGRLKIMANGGHVFGTSQINDDKWHHIAVVVDDGNPTLFETKIYVDGKSDKLDLPHSVDKTFDIRPHKDGKGMRIGLGLLEFGTYFNGSLDELKVFSKPLSEQEIQKIFQQR